jgi:hypothetical protein
MVCRAEKIRFGSVFNAYPPADITLSCPLPIFRRLIQLNRAIHWEIPEKLSR